MFIMLKNILILGIIVLFAGIGLFVAGSIPQTESYVETVPTQVTKPVQVTVLFQTTTPVQTIVPFETTKPVQVIKTEQVIKSTTWQVEWRTITGEGKWGAPVGYSTFPATFTYNWDMGKVYGDYSDYIGFIAKATIYVPRYGPVSFTVGSDDGSRLYLDDTLIIDLWWDHYYTEKSTTIYLNPGKYTLTLYYYDRTGYAKVSFYADPDVLTWTETVQRTVTEYHIVTEYRTDTRYRIITEYRVGTQYQIATTYTEVTKERTFVDLRLQILGLVIVGMGAAFTVVGASLIIRRRPAS
jgi:hypothetical protein